MVEYLNNNALFGTIFIFVVVTLAVLGVRFKLFHNFSVPYIIGWLIELLCPVVILLFQFVDALFAIVSHFEILGMNLYSLVFLVSALDGVFLAAVLFRDSTRINQLTYVEQNQLEGHVLAYVNPEFKLIDTTILFKHHFSASSDWRTQIKEFMINGETIPTKFVLKKMKELKDQSFTASVVLNDGQILTEDCIIKAMYQIHHLMAYGIVVAEETYTEAYLKSQSRQARKQLYTYFDIVDGPVAYYDSSLKVMNLNKDMVSLLNETKEQLSLDDFKAYIVDEDKDIFGLLTDITEEEATISKTYITAKTINGENTFKVMRLQNEGVPYIVVSLAHFNELKMSMGTQQDFTTALAQKATHNQTLRCMGIHFTNASELNAHYGAEAFEGFINQYFISLVQDKVLSASSIYRLDNGNYGVIFDDYQDYMMISRDLNAGISKMLHMNCYLGYRTCQLDACVVALDSSRFSTDALNAVTVLNNYLTLTSEQKQSFMAIEHKEDVASLAKEADIALDDAFDSILNK